MKHFEIEASVIRAKNGNKQELLKILEQYKPFIYKTAKSYYIKDFDMYDLTQIGYVSLINAVAKYKSNSHTFSTYAFNTIKNAYKYTARQNNRYNDNFSLNTPISCDEKNSAEFIDHVDSFENLEEDLIKAERAREVRRAVSKLPSEDMELVILVYFNGCSIKTYSEKKDITYLQACRRRKKALEKLNKYLSKN